MHTAGDVYKDLVFPVVRSSLQYIVYLNIFLILIQHYTSWSRQQSLPVSSVLSQQQHQTLLHGVVHHHGEVLQHGPDLLTTVVLHGCHTSILISLLSLSTVCSCAHLTILCPETDLLQTLLNLATANVCSPLVALDLMCNYGGIVVFPQGQNFTIGTAMDWSFLMHIDVDIQGKITFTNDTVYW
jgi:hypothetical protein